MAKIAVLEMKVNVQMALDNLKSKDRKEFIRENLSVRDINKVMKYFNRIDIMCWLDEHAEEYGYTKRGIRIYKSGGLKHNEKNSIQRQRRSEPHASRPDGTQDNDTESGA